MVKMSDTGEGIGSLTLTVNIELLPVSHIRSNNIFGKSRILKANILLFSSSIKLFLSRIILVHNHRHGVTVLLLVPRYQSQSGDLRSPGVKLLCKPTMQKSHSYEWPCKIWISSSASLALPLSYL